MEENKRLYMGQNEKQSQLEKNIKGKKYEM